MSEPSCSSNKAPEVEVGEGITPEVRRVADNICVGCRCGWLCCECLNCCMICKDLRRYCYCQWDPTPNKKPCCFCCMLGSYCKCWDKYRCKWCLVSLAQCKRGGCLTLLPARHTPEAAPFVHIFNTEDIEDPEDAPEEQQQQPEQQQPDSGSPECEETASLVSFNTTSMTGFDTGSVTNLSVSSSMQKEWWASQRSEDEETTSFDSASICPSVSSYQ